MSAKTNDTSDEPTINHHRDSEAVAKRVNRALDSFFHVESAGDNAEYTVFSGSGSSYTVDLSDGSCTCPDGQRGPWCKHAHRAAFVTGEVPDIDGVHVAISESDDTDDDLDEDSEDDGETLAERVERFDHANPGASAIMVISQLGIDPSQKGRIEEILN
jgi:hypothetical protein